MVGSIESATFKKSLKLYNRPIVLGVIARFKNHDVPDRLFDRGVLSKVRKWSENFREIGLQKYPKPLSKFSKIGPEIPKIGPKIPKIGPKIPKIPVKNRFFRPIFDLYDKT